MLFPWQVALVLIAGCVTLALAFVAQTQRKLLVAGPFALACLLGAAWCFIYAWLLMADTLEEKLLVLKLGISVIGFLPLVALEVTYRFVHERPLLRGWTLAAWAVVPAISAGLAWTINASPIFRYDCWLDTSGPVSLIRFSRGPWNAVFMLYCIAAAFWSYVVLLRALPGSSSWARRAIVLFLIARVIPLAFELLFHFEVLPPAGMNYAPMSIALSDILLGIILFGDRLGYRAHMVHSTLVEKISDLLVVMDGENRVLDMNHAAVVELGVPLEAMLGQSVDTLFASWPEVPALLRAGPERVEEVVREGKCFELIITSIESGAGPVLLWLRNITRLKLAEGKTIQAATEARQANEAKDHYLAFMSHEIRSPLNSVLGFMRLLEKTPLNSDQKEYVGHVSRDGANLLAVINEVLDFSKIEAGGMHLFNAPFDLREAVTNLCRGLELQAREKGLGFTSDIAPQIPRTLVGDKSRVLQILRNLIVNAVKFTPQGMIGVKVECPESEAHTNECLLRMTVTDTGIGISGEEMEALFQPFSQASHAIQHTYGGTGLGLVISRRFSEMMGGSLTVESLPDHGSTFTCLLRLTRGEAPLSDSPVAGTGGVLTPLRILIVDDQPVNRRLLQLLLAQMNHEVVAATSGTECLALVQKEDFDIVIMDIEMPGLDGFETSRQIRRIRHGDSHSPYLIALTAHASTDIREQCFAAGMNDYLSKPIIPQALEVSLESAVALTRQRQMT